MFDWIAYDEALRRHRLRTAGDSPHRNNKSLDMWENGGEMGCGEWFKNRVAMAFHLPVETASECKHEEHGYSHVTQEKGGSRCGVPGEAAWRAPAAERKQLQS